MFILLLQKKKIYFREPKAISCDYFSIYIQYCLNIELVKFIMLSY